MAKKAEGRRMEVSVSVIVHATESRERILDSLRTSLGLESGEFSAGTTTGHFGNPIVVLNSSVTGRGAEAFARRFCGLLSEEQLNALVGQIEERTVDSRFHVRIDKQSLIRDGRLVIIDNDGKGADAVKIKIHTPIYSKRDIVPIFTGILRGG